jgi:hypothetical protein
MQQLTPCDWANGYLLHAEHEQHASKQQLSIRLQLQIEILKHAQIKA